MRGTHAQRKAMVAAKDHKCFGGSCDGIVPKGEYYIADRLVAVGFVPSETKTLMALAWHLGCAPLTRETMMKELVDAQALHVKHPTRTGAEYADA